MKCIPDEPVESSLEPAGIKGRPKEARVSTRPAHVTARTGFALDDGTVQMNIKPD